MLPAATLYSTVAFLGSAGAAGAAGLSADGDSVDALLFSEAAALFLAVSADSGVLGSSGAVGFSVS
ncbi:hypothetical protein D3C78_1767130 [compost metagenome]